MRQALEAQPAFLVRGSSRRIMSMRFRPANIRVINRRVDRLGRHSRCFPLARRATRSNIAKFELDPFGHIRTGNLRRFESDARLCAEGGHGSELRVSQKGAAAQAHGCTRCGRPKAQTREEKMKKSLTTAGLVSDTALTRRLGTATHLEFLARFTEVLGSVKLTVTKDNSAVPPINAWIAGIVV